MLYAVPMLSSKYRIQDKTMSCHLMLCSDCGNRGLQLSRVPI